MTTRLDGTASNHGGCDSSRFVLITAAIALIAGCGPPSASVMFSGDRGAAGARIIVDSLEIGRLPTEPADWASPADIADSALGVYQFDARVKLGRHLVVAITANADTLRGEFESHESASVHVSTCDKKIRSASGSSL